MRRPTVQRGRRSSSSSARETSRPPSKSPLPRVKVPRPTDQGRTTMNDQGSGSVVKVITVIGESPESFAKAADAAVRKAQQTIRNITGVDVISMSATVDANPG